jgi:hypothetical protein
MKLVPFGGLRYLPPCPPEPPPGVPASLPWSSYQRGELVVVRVWGGAKFGQTVRKLNATLSTAARRAKFRDFFLLCSPTGREIRAALDAPRSFRTVCKVMAREFQDDLVSVNAARLRALGVIKPGAESAIVSFADGADALRREVRVWHRKFRNGRGISLFLCPVCGGKAQLLKLHDGQPHCRNCLKRRGVHFRIAYGTRLGRAEARTIRIEKLRAKLAGGPLRLDGRGMARRRELELSLRRALIRDR